MSPQEIKDNVKSELQSIIDDLEISERDSPDAEYWWKENDDNSGYWRFANLETIVQRLLDKINRL